MGFSIKEGCLYFNLLWHATLANACGTVISILEPSLPHKDVYLVYTVCLESLHGNFGFRVMEVTLTEFLNVVNMKAKLVIMNHHAQERS